MENNKLVKLIEGQQRFLEELKKELQPQKIRIKKKTITMRKNDTYRGYKSGGCDRNMGGCGR